MIKDGDMLFYGNLLEELQEGRPGDFWKELRRIAESYLQGGADRTRDFHGKVDETIAALLERDARFGYPAPFCHKGCANCCHELVYCTSEEAALIHAYCRENKIEMDREKLERQLRYLETDARLDHTGVTTWDDQPEGDQSCAFLNGSDHSCSIWPVRPYVCRVHLAEETDRYCRPRNGAENPDARGITYIELNYMLSVIFTIHRDSIKKTMGRLLLGYD